MYEVEAKVAINNKDFKRLQRQLKKDAKFKACNVKQDTYYNNPKKSFIRMRKENKKNLFNIKDKSVKKGIEANIEIEWEIKNNKQWNITLGKLGINPSVHKTKKTEAYQLNNFNIELNHISKLGYFLEIETMVKSKNQIRKAEKELIDMFRRFGYNQKDFEKKYYLQLLKEKNNI